MALLRWLGPLLLWLSLAPLGLGSFEGAPPASDRASRSMAATPVSPDSADASAVTPPEEPGHAPVADVDAWDAADDDDGSEPAPSAVNDDDVFLAVTHPAIPPGASAPAAPLDEAGLRPARGHARGTEHPPETA